MALSFQDKIKPVATTTSGGGLSFQDKVKPIVKQPQVEENPNNIVQDLVVNTVGRPALRFGQTVATIGAKIFGSKATQERMQEVAQEPVELPLGLGTVQGQKKFGEGGATQMLFDTGKSALDIATLGAGSAVNTGIKTGISKIGGSKLLSPIVNQVAKSKVASYITSKIPGLAANVTEGLAYNAGYNVLNKKDAMENAGVVAGVSAILPPVIKGAIGTAKYAKGALNLNPEAIMQRVARISKAKQSKFEQTAGESVGKYLTNRGIYGDVDEISGQLYKRFETSRNLADQEIAKLPGLYKQEVIDTALNELMERETRVSAPGAISPDYNRVTQLLNKHKNEGLTMSEINEAKRLFERNVTLDYLKDRVTDKIQKAKNIDNNIRKWQFETADNLGLKNLPEINRETRLARQLADDLGKEYSGSAGNNAITLTDWIMLSGGDPTSVSAFLVKRTLSNKKIQSKIAKAIQGEPTIGLPKAQTVPQVMLPAGNRGGFQTEVRTSGSTLPILPRDKSIDPVGFKNAVGDTMPTQQPQYSPVKPYDDVRMYEPYDAKLPTINAGVIPKKKSTLPKAIGAPKVYLGSPQATTATTNKNKTINKIGIDSSIPSKTNASKEVIPSQKKSLLGDIKQKFNETPNKQGGFIKTGTDKQPDLTTVILEDLKDKTTVSKQYILDATNRGELKQTERDITREVLDTMPEGPINVKEFSEKVREQLLPLKVKSTASRHVQGGTAKYENVALPDDLRGNVKNYKENIYESPIKTSAGSTHFGGATDNYFGHTRIEDMADNKTRRVIEVQSDLYQKGNLEKEAFAFSKENKIHKVGETVEKDGIEFVITKDLGNGEYKAVNAEKLNDYADYLDDPETATTKQLIAEMRSQRPSGDLELPYLTGEKASPRLKELSKLQQYSNPTAHFRMVREEIKQAAKDGKTKLQFPTGETAMKVEGLSGDSIDMIDAGNIQSVKDFVKENLKETLDMKEFGKWDVINTGHGDMVVFDVEEGIPFRGVPINTFKQRVKVLKKEGADPMDLYDDVLDYGESISGVKSDTTNNPIYKFYEKDLQKFLNKFDAKKVTDDKGVTWFEMNVPKDAADKPVQSFGKIGANPLLAGAAGLGAFAGGMKLGNVIGTKIGNKIADIEQEAEDKTNVLNIVDTIRHNESRGEKRPYSFSQFSGKKELGKALGAYQVTEGELKSYAKKYLGKAVTAQEFLKDPKMQEDYIKNKVESLLSRGLSVPQILAVHRYGGSDLTDEGLKKVTQKARDYVKEGMQVYATK